MLKVGLISLGCPKNLVDSEVMLGILTKGGLAIAEDIKDADIAIVNTCGFIRDAKEESLDVISELIELKRSGALKKLIVAGCLAQRYERELNKELQEVDCFVGTNDFRRIKEIAENLNGSRESFVSAPAYLYDDATPRLLLTPAHYAYIKLADGCGNNCGYCVIPRLRGAYRSREVESIVREVERLSLSGMLREINLISQDTANYGVDLYKRKMLAPLLERLSHIDAIRWIRLLYNHPAHITDEFIEVMRGHPKVIKYIDLPLQHINDRLLSAMNRKITKRDILRLIEKIRAAIPDVVLRSAFIVGLPGETDKEFAELVDFVKETRFERLGVFSYSKEDGTPAYDMPAHIPEDIKKERLNIIMALQREISEEINGKYLGKALDVLIDEQDKDEPGLYLGRTYMDAPEVDGTVFVKGNCEVGEIVGAKIVDTYEYDLVGEYEPSQ